ncbi:hypothetical protein HMPREF1531_00156 [Propionibacterium sp. oral taxon 192 str. F0372]|nr:hypothetical protein HMPREF1531_00156 [Propionibacterium sp. oral taxon 192 str. F0372]
MAGLRRQCRPCRDNWVVGLVLDRLAELRVVRLFGHARNSIY